MEKELLKIFKLADELNDKQDKVYAHIEYEADNQKKFEILIKSKKDFRVVEKMQIILKNDTDLKWNSLINMFECYVGGAINED